MLVHHPAVYRSRRTGRKRRSIRNRCIHPAAQTPIRVPFGQSSPSGTLQGTLHSRSACKRRREKSIERDLWCRRFGVRQLRAAPEKVRAARSKLPGSSCCRRKTRSIPFHRRGLHSIPCTRLRKLYTRYTRSHLLEKQYAPSEPILSPDAGRGLLAGSSCVSRESHCIKDPSFP